MAGQTDPSLYKIMSVYDGTCLDVRGGNQAENETPIITYDFHGGPNQLWRASLRGEGVVLASLDQSPSSNRILDQRVEDGKVQIYDDKGRKALHQKWYLEEVNVGRKIYIIWNLANNKCLQNNGTGKQVTAVDPKAIKPRHQWRIERI